MRIIVKKATRKPLYTISSMLIILFVYIQIPLLGFSKHYHVFVCQTRCYQDTIRERTAIIVIRMEMLVRGTL